LNLRNLIIPIEIELTTWQNPNEMTRVYILLGIFLAIDVILLILFIGVLFKKSFQRRIGKNLFTLIHFGLMLELISFFSFFFSFFFFLFKKKNIQRETYNLFLKKKVKIIYLVIRISLECFHPAKYSLVLTILAIGFIFFAVLLLNW